jgi:hypothetical protein
LSVDKAGPVPVRGNEPRQCPAKVQNAWRPRPLKEADKAGEVGGS